jgi:voltage-gated potassium channel Kch
VTVRRGESFWWTDVGLSVLLASLVAVIFVIPALTARAEEAAFVAQMAFVTAVFASGVVVAGRDRTTTTVASAVIAVTVSLSVVHHFVPGARTGACRAGAGAVTCAMLAVLVVQRVFEEGPITLRRIQGAVAVYLLLGLAWTNVYQVIAYVVPGAFRVGEPVSGDADMLSLLGYFSFVTLTTVGYGDVAPVHPAARSAAVIEALVGQLFPAILIARLVAMELTSRERGR